MAQSLSRCFQLYAQALDRGSRIYRRMADWERCSECEGAGIRGGHCLAHLTPDEFADEIESLRDGDRQLDARGVAITPELLAALLTALTIKDQRQVPPSDFRQALFSGDVSFEGARFSGNASFNEARFSGNASFEGARFSRDARSGGRGSRATPASGSPGSWATPAS